MIFSRRSSLLAQGVGFIVVMTLFSFRSECSTAKNSHSKLSPICSLLCFRCSFSLVILMPQSLNHLNGRNTKFNIGNNPKLAARENETMFSELLSLIVGLNHFSYFTFLISLLYKLPYLRNLSSLNHESPKSSFIARVCRLGSFNTNSLPSASFRSFSRSSFPFVFR